MTTRHLNLVFSLFFSLVLSCAVHADTTVENTGNSTDMVTKLVISDSQQVAFTFPKGWSKNSKKTPYDMQHTAADKSMNSAVFIYLKSDLAKDMNAEKILEFHVDDLRGKRKNFELLEAQKSLPIEQGTIISESFAADKNTSRNNYVVSVIALAQAPEVLLTVIQVSVPSAWQKNKTVLDGILQSASVVK